MADVQCSSKQREADFGVVRHFLLSYVGGLDKAAGVELRSVSMELGSAPPSPVPAVVFLAVAIQTYLEMQSKSSFA